MNYNHAIISFIIIHTPNNNEDMWTVFAREHEFGA